MNYKYYFFEELKKRLLMLPIILLIIAAFWFVDSGINMLNVSFWSLFLILCFGTVVAAFIKYKNNGKDVWGNY
jgi:hypothetical protein